jgi:putative oxidoreductase
MGLSLGKSKRTYGIERDIGLLTIRGTTGGLMAGHGAQKLFGWFGGYGLEGTSGWLESMGLRPGRAWAIAAGASEFGGGVLTGLGLLHPLGPIAMLGSMGVAIRKAHWGKPIWVSAGGAELPVTNIAVGIALSLVDPGRLSLDHALGIRVPAKVAVLAAAGVVLGVVASEGATPPAAEEAAETELQGGEEAASTDPPTGESA